MVKAEEWKRPACVDGACVEVRITNNKVYIRSSEVPGHVTAFTKQEWDAFISGAKAGEFDID
jgi:hypothetical protein